MFYRPPLSRDCCHLQGAGCPGSSVQWGAWGGAGMAVQVTGFMERMARMGLGILLPPIGLAALSHVLQSAWTPRWQEGCPTTVGKLCTLSLMMPACMAQSICRTVASGCSLFTLILMR